MVTLFTRCGFERGSKKAWDDGFKINTVHPRSISDKSLQYARKVAGRFFQRVPLYITSLRAYCHVDPSHLDSSEIWISIPHTQIDG
jgi:hypothetical protein